MDNFGFLKIGKNFKISQETFDFEKACVYLNEFGYDEDGNCFIKIDENYKFILFDKVLFTFVGYSNYKSIDDDILSIDTKKIK